MNRSTILRHLITYDVDIASIRNQLKLLSWDSNTYFATLSAKDIIRIIERCLKNELTFDQISEWSNLIEGREDIGFHSKEAPVVKQIIFELANPEIEGVLSIERLELIKQKLGSLLKEDV